MVTAIRKKESIKLSARVKNWIVLTSFRALTLGVNGNLVEYDVSWFNNAEIGGLAMLPDSY